jgi:phosphoribosylanthranilate isomerase
MGKGTRILTDVKVCGLSSPEAVDACVAHGAKYVGFVFYPPSPRNVAIPVARQLSMRLPAGLRAVGLFVEPSDDQLRDVISQVPLDMIQLHGGESPGRVAEVRQSISMPVIKALRIGDAGDVDNAAIYDDVSDMLLFDARPPANVSSLPGGNGIAFDWTLLAGRTWRLPWLLSGGLTPATVAGAVAATGAKGVDVSSGVEERPGVKNVQMIGDFIKNATT